MFSNYIFLFTCCSLFALCGCAQNNTSENTYDEYRNQRIEARDSLYILHTLKGWGEADWWTWGVRSDIYKLNSNDVEYYIAGTFYSPDRKLLLVWAGQKKPNADTRKSYNTDDAEVNRLCPNGADTVYSLTALIGIRDSSNQTWKLYPFNQQQATCYSNKQGAINVLEQYYFREMKMHQMYRMMQSGARKGHKVLQKYDYNLQDKDFWDKCWLFQKDTVGSYGLYPFQIKGYRYDGDRCTQNCAEPYNLPAIEYPKRILDLY